MDDVTASPPAGWSTAPFAGWRPPPRPDGVLAGWAAQHPSAPGPDLVYAIGTIGVDFGTEARRDGFRQQMAANPYDPHQLHRYLVANPWASDELIWTLNLDRTPIYALVADTPVGVAWGPFAAEPGRAVESVVGNPQAPEGVVAGPRTTPVRKIFRDALVGQIQKADDPTFVSRVSVPGVLTERTVRLFSGQEVPVLEVSARGAHTWDEARLVKRAVEEVRRNLAASGSEIGAPDGRRLNDAVRASLDRLYAQVRNLGRSSPDRALNYAAANTLMITQEFAGGLASGSYVSGPDQGLYALDTISVARSPYCRMDSDCWDVSMRFVDTENQDRTRVTYRFTIDVSDELPVSLAPAHRFLEN